MLIPRHSFSCNRDRSGKATLLGSVGPGHHQVHRFWYTAPTATTGRQDLANKCIECDQHSFQSSMIAGTLTLYVVLGPNETAGGKAGSSFTCPHQFLRLLQHNFHHLIKSYMHPCCLALAADCSIPPIVGALLLVFVVFLYWRSRRPRYAINGTKMCSCETSKSWCALIGGTMR